MRLIVTLAGLLIVGFLITKQLQSPSASPGVSQATSGTQVPNVPTTPQELPQFREDMTSFINQTAKEQAQQIEQAIQP